MSGTGVKIPPPPQSGGNILAWCVEAYKAIRKTRPRAGVGMRETQTEDGVILSAVPVPSVTTHPFKISAEFNTIPPTGLICTVAFGQVNSDTPRFPGTAGSSLGTIPAPTHTIALTPDVYYFYLVVQVTKDGVYSDCYIDVDTAIPSNVHPVPDDMPAEGNSGTAGTYYFQVGEVEIYTTGGNYYFEVRQTLSLSQTFKWCDDVASIIGV